MTAESKASVLAVVLAPSRPYWLQGITCPSWCDGDHDTEDSVLDRRHYGPRFGQIVLTVDETAHEAKVDEALELGARLQTTAAIEPPYLAVDLDQHVRASAPRIRIGLCETGKGYDLTVDEAQALADALLRAVDTATGDFGALAADAGVLNQATGGRTRQARLVEVERG